MIIVLGSTQKNKTYASGISWHLARPESTSLGHDRSGGRHASCESGNDITFVHFPSVCQFQVSASQHSIATLSAAIERQALQLSRQERRLRTKRSDEEPEQAQGNQRTIFQELDA
jgi:hypothetical protein